MSKELPQETEAQADGGKPQAGPVDSAGAAAAAAKGVSAERLIEQRAEEVDDLAAELARERQARLAPEQAPEEPGEEAEEAEEAEEPVAKAPEEPQNEEPDTAPILVEEDGETYIALKVDGVEKKMSLSDAQAELQRRESGSARLQEAATERTRLQAVEQRLAAREKELAEKPPEAPAEPAPKTEDVSGLADELTEALLNGDKSMAAEKLATVLSKVDSGARPATASTSEIADAVMQKVNEQQAVRQQFDVFAKEYPDIVENPEAFGVADAISTQVEAEHPDWDPLRIMREAGDRFRRIAGAKPPEAQAPEKPTPQQEAKSRLTRVPPPGGVGEVVAMPKQPRRTVDDLVEEMNVQRRGKAAMGMK